MPHHHIDSHKWANLLSLQQKSTCLPVAWFTRSATGIGWIGTNLCWMEENLIWMRTNRNWKQRDFTCYCKGKLEVRNALWLLDDDAIWIWNSSLHFFCGNRLKTSSFTGEFQIKLRKRHKEHAANIKKPFIENKVILQVCKLGAKANGCFLVKELLSAIATKVHDKSTGKWIKGPFKR